MRYLECVRRAFPRARGERERRRGQRGLARKKKKKKREAAEHDLRETKERRKGGGRHANVCVPCGGALFTRQLMSSETRRKLWTSRTAGTGCSFTEAASGSAVERELLPNGSGEKIERGVKMSDVILNTRDASRRRGGSDCAVADNKNVDSSFLDAASCAKMALKTRGTVDTPP